MPLNALAGGGGSFAPIDAGQNAHRNSDVTAATSPLKGLRALKLARMSVNVVRSVLAGLDDGNDDRWYDRSLQ